MKSKLFNRVFSALASLMLIVCLPQTTVFAADETVDTWDGSADISWYNENDTEFHLTTAEQLAGLAQLTNTKINSEPKPHYGNSFENKIIYLDNDLDLGGYNWTSIGDKGNEDQYYFKGTFDGQGHSIYNLSANGTERNDHNALFGTLEKNGTVKNLNVINANVRADDYSLHVGILADMVINGKIINCYTSGTVESVNGWRNIGGIAGSCMQSTQLIGCASDADVISTNLGNPSDTVGGLVGGWELANGDSLISDCWFGGSVRCEYEDSAVSGILGMGYNTRVSNVTINNCMVAVKDITSVEPENISWIAMLRGEPVVSNCLYPDDNGAYPSVTKLDNTGTADTSFDSSVCGQAVSDFTDNDVLASLQNHASQGVNWVKGIEHPTFSWDLRNMLADYTAVDGALEKIPQDFSIYTEETVSALQNTVNSVDRALSAAEQDKVEAMAKAIEDAVAALVYRDADYSKVDEAIAKAEALNKEKYKDFSQVEAAINAVVRGKNITEQAEVDEMAKAIENAIASLVYKDADQSKGDEAGAPVNLEGVPSSAPDTGDDSNITFWLIIMLAAGAVMTGTVLYRRKKSVMGNRSLFKNCADCCEKS